MSFPRYEKYKDSGISWLGEIPSHWQARRAKFLFDRKQRPVSDDDDIVTAFRDGQVTLRKNRREDGFTVALKEIGYQGVRQGDLVIHAMDAFAGAVGVSDSDGKCSPVYSCCEPKEKVIAPFYGYLVRTMALAGFIESLAKGVRERSTDFRWGDFSSLELPLPPVEEQKQAVSFIAKETGKIDALVAEQEKLIGLLKEKRQAVISHAVTKGLDPNARMKDSGVEWLGEVPEGWEVKRLRYLVLAIESGVSVNAIDVPADENEFGVLKTSCVYRGVFNPSENKAVIPAEYERVSCPVRAGTLIVSRMNTPDLVGASGAVLENQDNLFLPDRLWQIYFQSADPEFIHLWCQTPYYRGQVKLACAGTSSSMQNLSQGEFCDFILALPPEAIQKNIITVLRHETVKIDALIEEAQKAIELMKERRTALISAAVTGKVDVRGWRQSN